MVFAPRQNLRPINGRYNRLPLQTNRATQAFRQPMNFDTPRTGFGAQQQSSMFASRAASINGNPFSVLMQQLQQIMQMIMQQVQQQQTPQMTQGAETAPGAGNTGVQNQGQAAAVANETNPVNTTPEAGEALDTDQPSGTVATPVNATTNDNPDNGAEGDNNGENPDEADGVERIAIATAQEGDLEVSTLASDVDYTNLSLRQKEALGSSNEQRGTSHVAGRGYLFGGGRAGIGKEVRSGLEGIAEEAGLAAGENGPFDFNPDELDAVRANLNGEGLGGRSFVDTDFILKTSAQDLRDHGEVNGYTAEQEFIQFWDEESAAAGRTESGELVAKYGGREVIANDNSTVNMPTADAGTAEFSQQIEAETGNNELDAYILSSWGHDHLDDGDFNGSIQLMDMSNDNALLQGNYKEAATLMAENDAADGAIDGSSYAHFEKLMDHYYDGTEKTTVDSLKADTAAKVAANDNITSVEENSANVQTLADKVKTGVRSAVQTGRAVAENVVNGASQGLKDGTSDLSDDPGKIGRGVASAAASGVCPYLSGLASAGESLPSLDRAPDNAAHAAG